jgi:ABC-type transport system involved in multi-copper enzyme maturation permease subunit
MKFLAILKDSFREAVDGWVIFVMFALSLLLILFVAQFSVEPVPAEEAFQEITHKFMIVYPDRGQGSFARPFFYDIHVINLEKTNDSSAPQAGDYRFVLKITDFAGTVTRRGPHGAVVEADDNDKSKDDKEKKNGEKEKKEKMPSAFRQAVAYWSKPATRDEVFAFKEVEPTGVTDELMVEFLRDQFLTHGNMNVEKIAKRPSTAEGTFEFDVETKGLKGAKGWPHNPHFLFGVWKLHLPLTLGTWLYLLESTLVSDIGATIVLLVGVIITAFYIPNMMRKGSIDLLLSKPMSRPLLLLYKYIGGMTFVFINTVFAVGGVWLVIGLRTGVWGTGILWTIPAVTFYFAILYAISTLAAVLTRNAIVAILVTMAFWAVMFVVGFVHNKLEPYRDDKTLEIPKTVYTVSDTVNAALPRTTDLDNLMNKLVVDDTLGVAEKRQMKKDKFTYPPWGEVVGVSGAYIVIMLGLACWRFTTRDY